MEYIKLYETYKSQKEIELLTNDILKICAKKTFDDIHKYILFTQKNNIKTTNYIKTLFTVYLNEDVDNDILNKYNVLKDFIMNSRTIILFSEENKYNQKNSAFFTFTIYGREIHIFYSKDFIINLNDSYNQGHVTESYDIYFKLYYEVHEHVMHELQHSYDHWRSKNGLAIKQSKIFDDNRKEYMNSIMKYRNGETLTDNEINYLNNHHIEYLNLKHEIDARFTTAISKIRQFKSKFNNGNIEEWYIIPWKDYLQEFKLNMTGYDKLSETDKKRIHRKLSQFYEFDKEEVIKRNEKINNEK